MSLQDLTPTNSERRQGDAELLTDESERRDVQGRAASVDQCVVRFLAQNSPPDQLKSVLEDCELLSDSESLMTLDFINEVCEDAHDNALDLLPFLFGSDQRPSQLILCKEGKRAGNIYVYPPAKLRLTISHATCSLISPPVPASASDFPRELEPYRTSLELAFSSYISGLYKTNVVGSSLRTGIRARWSASVYSRIIPAVQSPGRSMAAEASTYTLKSKNFASCSQSAIHFLRFGVAEKVQDDGPFEKLTAIFSMRHMNADSCWASSWTGTWEIYFSRKTKRLVAEGNIGVRSHSCEDWNSQIVFTKSFRTGASEAKRAGISERHLSGEGSSRKTKRREQGIYCESCEEVALPDMLTREIMAFVQETLESSIEKLQRIRIAYGSSCLRNTLLLIGSFEIRHLTNFFPEHILVRSIEVIDNTRSSQHM